MAVKPALSSGLCVISLASHPLSCSGAMGVDPQQISCSKTRDGLNELSLPSWYRDVADWAAMRL
jgi:hypothetical protein